MLGLRLRRKLWRRRHVLPPALEAVWTAPLPAAGSRVENLSFLVCDAEMSGLDASQAELLSLGWVAIDNLEVCLGTAKELLLRPRRGVGQSATIHRLRDCELQGGLEPEAALEAFLEAVRGRIPVFHNASLDTAFLDRVSRDAWGLPLLLPAVDTLRIEERRLRRRSDVVPEGAVRLAACRERYGLGAFGAHAALGDALATAELFLAQVAARGPGLRLRDLR